ncbi:hypothetical protein FRC06_009723 [Ceratobasidium sp. 370]|nr:hypothetical protein FRC06_009723 [Ceratobasidium sp. 370]
MEAAEEPACGGCQKTLESASGGVVVAFGNALWHVECFRCAKCRTTVSADTNLLLLADGSPVCQSCSYSCHVCNNPILDEAIMTGDDSYHAACFKCRSCSRRIEELVFAKTSQGIYCMSCHNDRVARSRRHAEQKKRSRTRSRRDTSHAPSPAVQSPATPSHPSASRRHPTEPAQTSSPAPLSSSPSPALLTAAQPDLGKRRKSYDDGVRPLSSFFAMGPGVSTRSPSTGKTFATQQQVALGGPSSSPNNSGLGIPSTTTSRADKRRSINPGLVMPPEPPGRPRGNSVGAPVDERGQLSPYPVDEPAPKQTANSIKSGAGSMSSRAPSPSFSTRDMFGPTRNGSIDTRAGSIDMHIPGQDDAMSILGPGEGEITMMFEEPSFTLDEPTVTVEPTFVLDEPAVAMMMMDEMEMTDVAVRGSRADGSENANGGIGAGIERSRSPGFGRSASPSGLGMNMVRGASPGLGRNASPGPGPNGRTSPANLGRSASPAALRRGASPQPHDLGRSISPNGLGGRSVSPSPGLGRSVSPSPGLGRSVSPRMGRSTSPSSAQDQNPNGTTNSAQGRSTSPLVVKSASQGATSTSPYAVRRNESPAGPRNGSSPLVAKSASQGAISNGVGGAKAPVAKGMSVNGVNGVNGAKPSPARSKSGARESLPPPAVPPKDKSQEGGHHHTLSYPALSGSVFGSGSVTPASAVSSTSNLSTASIRSTSTSHTSRPTHPRSSSSSSSSPVIEHAATATYGAMQLPPMRFSLSDTDFADLLKGVGVDSNGKLRLSLIGRGSLDQERDKGQKEKNVQEKEKEKEVVPSKPAPEQTKSAPEQVRRRPSVDTEKRRPSVDTDKRRPSADQRASVDTSASAPTSEPFPRFSSEARPSVSSERPSFTIAESTTASVLEEEEEEFGQNTTLATPVIRLAPPSTPFRERVDSTTQGDSVMQRLKEMAESAREHRSTSVKINLEFLDAITKAVAGSQEKYSALKGRYDGVKRQSQQFIDGLSVAQSEYDKELAARRDAEAEVTRLRVQLSGQAARLTAMSAEARIREVGEQQAADANAALRALLRDVAKLRTERDMVVAEIDELGKKSGSSLEPLEARLEALRKQYRKDLETLKLQREGLVKEITELKEHRDIFLEETTALNARNEELAELNAQIQRQVEQQVAVTAVVRPPLPHMSSSGAVATQLSLGSSLKEFGAKSKPPQGGISAPSASVSSVNTTLSMLSTLTATTSNMSASEEKERDREEAKVVRVPAPQEPVTATAAKGGFKWLKGKAPTKEPTIQTSSSGKATAAAQPDRPKGFKEHNFVQQSVLRFARCDHCGDKMWGMQMRCSNCSVACHMRCTYSVKSSCQSVSTPDEEPVVDISPLQPSMFGRDLVEQVRADAKNDPGRMVPVIVDKCIRAVEALAMDYEGIYRKTGGSSQSKAITQLFERGNYDSFDLEDTDSFNDISSITSVMKTYFRQLPNPLLTFALHEKFVEAAAIRDTNVKREALISLIQQLPPEHYHTLRFLMLHLSRVKDCSEENLMTARNIGVVFGPTLMRSADPSREFGDMAGKALTIEWLVDYAPSIFSDPPPA